jgi:hypothetical protein
LLGSVVGVENASVQEWVKKEIKSWTKVLPLLARKEISVQLSLLLARWTIVAKPNFLCRTLPPHFTQSCLEEFDQAIVKTVEHRTQLHFDKFSQAMLQLPIRMGGVGFCPSAETAPHAFVAGIAAAISGFLGFSNLVKSGKWELYKKNPTMQAVHDVMQTYAQSPVKFDGKRDMTDLDTFTKHFCYTKHSSKLQSRIVSAIREHNFSIFESKDNLDLTHEQRAHLISRKNKHSAAVWKAYPLTEEFVLTDDDATFMLQYATRAPTQGLPFKCSCHSLLSLEHAVHCDTAKLQRHNMLQHRLVAFAREQAVTTAQNVRLSIMEARKKQEPDVIFYFAPKPLETDVTVVNPCAPSRILQTLSKAGSAVRMRCDAKNKKYLEPARERGHEFAPLGFETHGRFTKQVVNLLTKLAGNTPDNIGHAVSDMILDLSLTLVRGNALCARRTIARALRFRDLTRSRIA